MNERRQTLMFSATINKAVEKTAAEFLVKPVVIRVSTNRLEPSAIDQRIYHVNEADKDTLLMQLNQRRTRYKLGSGLCSHQT
jgi:superfamily II DNA/RNA helicase